MGVGRTGGNNIRCPGPRRTLTSTGGNTRAWLTVQPSTVNGTEIRTQEWRDYLFLRYCLDPPDLPKYCNGCNAKFIICHALECNSGGLIAAHHNDPQYRVAELDGKAFIPSHVQDNPLIFAGCAMKRPKAKLSGTIGSTDRDGASSPRSTEQKGDLLIRDLWQNRTDSVHNMRVVNNDANTHSVKTPEKLLQEAERGKK